MKCIIQRVSRASVTLQSGSLKNQQHIVASQQPQYSSTIGKGIVALIGIENTDNEKDVEYMVKKLLTLRLWPNQEGRQWASSVTDIEGDILCVSQFTLCGRNKKGSSLDFSRSMAPGQAKEMYEGLVKSLRQSYGHEDKVKDGVFGAMMDVQIENSGPVTIILESP